jgi:Asp-tRNA(Asn)/Glu-tRNA(Gln) amidotransferase B subunit
MLEYLKEILQKLLITQISDGVELKKCVKAILENNCNSIEIITDKFNVFSYVVGQYSKALKCTGIHN